MDLLTQDEYSAIAASLSFPTEAFIDGRFRPAISGKTYETVNPATGAHLANIASCRAGDVDFAVRKARDAFEDGRWSRQHPSARKDALIRLAKLLTRNARIGSYGERGRGKTILDCQTIDIRDHFHNQMARRGNRQDL